MPAVIVGNQVAVMLYDASGNPMFVANGSAITSSGVPVMGSDGTNARFIKTDGNGAVRIDPVGSTTQPVSGTVTANQGTAASAANRWPHYITDGTNTMPTMDAAVRAGFFKLTDGTNVHPTADVAARAAFTKVTDGTNTMPTGDAIARAIYHLITDGTNGPVAVKAASTAPAAADNALVTVLSPNQQAIPVTNSPAGSTTGIAVGEVATTATTDVVVRKTTYTEPASNAQRSVASSSASDAAAGTGARTIRITYYKADFTGPFTEDITLNGTAKVNTVSTTICYIEKIEVLTVGSNGSNVGIISLFGATAGGGGTVGTIAAGDNKTLWAHHYVATGKTCNITSLSGNNTNSSNNTRLSIRAKNLSVAAAPDILVSDTWVVGGGTAQTQRGYGTPVRVAGPARISVFGAPAGTPNITTRASFDFYDA
jgi:hypothetical protein